MRLTDLVKIFDAARFSPEPVKTIAFDIEGYFDTLPFNTRDMFWDSQWDWRDVRYTGQSITSI